MGVSYRFTDIDINIARKWILFPPTVVWRRSTLRYQCNLCTAEKYNTLQFRRWQ